MNFNLEPPAFLGLSLDPVAAGVLTFTVGTAPTTGETRLAAATGVGGLRGSFTVLTLSGFGGVTGEGAKLAAGAAGLAGITGGAEAGMAEGTAAGVSGLATGVGIAGVLLSSPFTSITSLIAGSAAGLLVSVGFSPGADGRETAGRSDFWSEAPGRETGGTAGGIAGVTPAGGVAGGTGTTGVDAFTSSFCEGATGLVPGIVFVILLSYKASHSWQRS